jgi:DNA-binding NtrC family response regulator
MTQTRKHSILLVDDEPEILYSLKGLLRREFDLHTAENAQEALDILEQQSIHVVMTDQRMPGMTGIELIKRVKIRHPEAIRIVFTGYADIKAVIEAVNNASLFRYITKPWDPDELIDVLRAAAAEYDELVARRELLRDVRRHIEQGQQLVDQLANRGNDQSVAPAHLERFSNTGISLAARIDKAIQH